MMEKYNDDNDEHEQDRQESIHVYVGSSEADEYLKGLGLRLGLGLKDRMKKKQRMCQQMCQRIF